MLVKFWFVLHKIPKTKVINFGKIFLVIYIYFYFFKSSKNFPLPTSLNLFLEVTFFFVN